MSSHLTARVYTLHGLAGEGVPESNIPKKTVESNFDALLTTPKSTQNENIRSHECQSSPLLTYRQCRRRWPAARGGGGTRRWPSPRPRGSCRSAHTRKVTQSYKVIQSSIVKFTCIGVVCPPPAPDHTNSLLSLPPLARYWKNIWMQN